MIPWWTEQQAALIGSLGGSAVGILGGTIGALAGFCAPRGKCKSLVFGLLAFMLGIGIIALVAGVIALLFHQPYLVFYPLILVGFICTILPAGAFPVLRRRYLEADLRRLEAEELRRS